MYITWRTRVCLIASYSPALLPLLNHPFSLHLHFVGCFLKMNTTAAPKHPFHCWHLAHYQHPKKCFTCSSVKCTRSLCAHLFLISHLSEGPHRKKYPAPCTKENAHIQIWSVWVYINYMCSRKPILSIDGNNDKMQHASTFGKIKLKMVSFLLVFSSFLTICFGDLCLPASPSSWVNVRM